MYCSIIVFRTGRTDSEELIPKNWFQRNKSEELISQVRRKSSWGVLSKQPGWFEGGQEARTPWRLPGWFTRPQRLPCSLAGCRQPITRSSLPRWSWGSRRVAPPPQWRWWPRRPRGPRGTPGLFWVVVAAAVVRSRWVHRRQCRQLTWPHRQLPKTSRA